MQAEFINPLLEATRDVVSSTLKTTIEIGQPFVRNTPSSYGTIGICVGITGRIRGQVIFSMKEDLALNIASTMMMTEIREMDEVSRSAVSELCNMIMGTAAARLYDRGLEIDITPPAFLLGENLCYLGTSKVQTLCIPLVLNGNSQIELEVFVARDS